MADDRIAIPPGPTECGLCTRVFKSIRGRALHVWHAHRLSAVAYYARFHARICPVCGKQRTLGKSATRLLRRTYCSWACANKARYKGRVVNTAGYIEINVSALAPAERERFGSMAAGRTPRILEHRLVVARRLGRALFAYEQVHHRNGVRNDNRSKNLQLRIGAHGKGADAAHVLCPHCGKYYDR